MLSRLRSLAVCTFVSLAAAATHAATLNVGPGQTYTTIQSAINAASTGDFIQVAPGTYTENIDYKSKGISIACNSSCTISNPGIIDGNGLGPVVTITNITAANASALLYGFTIQNGGKPQSTGGPQGGIYIANASPTIQKNILSKNFCAGITSISASPIIQSNQIRNTLTTGCAAAEGLGSGIALSGSSGFFAASITVNTIELNTASVSYSSDQGGGGAINITNAPVVYLYGNTLRNNTTTGYGGALYVANTPSLYFIENLVYGNKGISGGLDIVVPGKSVGPIAGLLANNTILDNLSTTTNGGSDIYIGGNLAQYALVNNIIVGYSSNDIAVNCGTTYAGQTITPLIFDHNDIYSIPNSGNVPVGGACTSPTGKYGNISVDPKFVSATAAAITAGTADFHLTTGSPVIDTGNNFVLDSGLAPTSDLDANPRPQDATNKGYPVIDMGVYEFAGVKDALPTVLSLTPSTYSPAIGGTLTLTAQLFLGAGGTPSGPVTFYEDNVSIGTSAMGSTGAATFAVTNLTAGTHTFYAVYPGQGAFTPSTSLVLYLLVAAPVSVNTNTTLTSSINPSAVGQSVTFTAHIVAADSSIPTGHVTFTDGSTTLNSTTVDASGNATYATSALAAGTHTITAAYAPTGNYNGSSASLTQVVNGAQSQSVLTVNPTSAAAGAPVTLTAAVSAVVTNALVPTGTVTFYNGTAIIGTAPLANGIAVLTSTTLPGGTDDLTCTYSGDANFSASSCNTVPVTIIAAATNLTLTSSVNPSPAATPITFTATLTSNGQPVPNVVVTITLNTSPGTSVNVTTNASGVATYTSMGLAAGTYLVTASTPATSSYNASAAPTLTEVVNANATKLTLTSSANPSPALTPFTLSALLTSSGQPSANQTLVLTLATLAPITLTTNASGIATYTNPGLAPGSYSATVTFAATGSLLASSAALAEVVVANPTATTLSATPNPSPQGQTVILTATVHASTGAASPTGNIRFFDGVTPIGFAALTVSNGALSTATLTTTSLTVGVHNLTAQYLGDLSQSFLPSTSAIFPETVLLQDFTLTSSSPTLTIATGHKGSLPLTLTSVGAFAGAVSISCNGPLPQYLTCEPPTLSLASGTTTTGTLTLDTNSVLNFYGANHTGPLPTHNNLGRIVLASLLPLTLLLGLSRRRHSRLTRSRLATALSLCLIGILTTSLTGCTGFYPASTPPGTYPITLTATGTPIAATSATIHTTTITLIVTK